MVSFSFCLEFNVESLQNLRWVLPTNASARGKCSIRGTTALHRESGIEPRANLHKSAFYCVGSTVRNKLTSLLSCIRNWRPAFTLSVCSLQRDRTSREHILFSVSEEGKSARSRNLNRHNLLKHKLS